MASIPVVRDGIKPGDVVIRAGLIMGTSKLGLSVLINEPYNHGGIALDANTVHHVEANGYENIPMAKFFADSSGGAVLRYKGLNEIDIAQKAAEIAADRRYPIIIGNPFSTAIDTTRANVRDTVSCQEFIHYLYLQAIQEVIADKLSSGDVQDVHDKVLHYGSFSKGPSADVLVGDFEREFEEALQDPSQLATVVDKYIALGINYIVNPRELRFDGMNPIMITAAEAVGRAEVTNPSQVTIKFEGTVDYVRIVPPPPSSTPWYRKLLWLIFFGGSDNWIWKMRLVAYTPKCFTDSPSFEIVGTS